MINEVKYSKFVQEGHIVHMIDVYELFKLYMNHRPFKGIIINTPELDIEKKSAVTASASTTNEIWNFKRRFL